MAIKHVKRLHETIVAGGVAINGVNSDGIVNPANLQAAAQPIIDTFDDSDAAQATADNLALRNKAIDDVDNSRLADSKRDRAVIDVAIDEINVLRGIVIGSNNLSFDPPSIANSSGVTSPNITVNGADFGDFVDVAAPYDLQGIMVTGYIGAANVVRVRLTNLTGAPINLGPGVWTVTVRRQAVLPPRTLAQAKTAIKNKINAGGVD